MELNKLVILINYCSYHKKFIKVLINECSKVTKNIMLIVGTHLYDKTLEDDSHLRDIVGNFPYITVLKFNSENLQHELKDAINKIATKSRIVGYKKALMRYEDVEWFLFLDSDEIPEGERLKNFLQSNVLNPENGILFANYWYFRDPIYRSNAIEQNPLLVHVSNMKDHILETKYGRIAYIDISIRDKTIEYVSDSKNPMFHHYSWCLNKELMKRKVEWSMHKKDHQEMFEKIEKEFSGPFSMKDFLHSYEYTVVENIFNIENE